MFNLIDVATWNRKYLYEKFLKRPILLNINIQVDVTRLYKIVKRKKIKFSYCFIYALSRAVNKNESFRISFNEKGEVGCYDILSPKITLLKKSADVYSSVIVDHYDDFLSFYKKCIEVIKEYEDYKGNDHYSNRNGRKDYFVVSYTPQMEFTSLVSTPYFDDLSETCRPCFAAGKWNKSFYKISVPVSFRINHLAVDGYHIEKFTRSFKEEINILANEIKRIRF